jgi:hypothetical protein
LQWVDVFQDLLALQVLPAPKEQPEPRVQLDILAQLAERVQQAQPDTLALRAIRVQLDIRGQPEIPGQRGQPVTRALPEDRALEAILTVIPLLSCRIVKYSKSGGIFLLPDIFLYFVEAKKSVTFFTKCCVGFSINED